MSPIKITNYPNVYFIPITDCVYIDQSSRTVLV